MHFGQLHYLPLPLHYFSFLVVVFLVLFALIQIRALQFVYARLGISAPAALLLLLASLLGSYVNIPITELPAQRVLINEPVVSFFGMPYVIPRVVDWPGTIIAVNVGGALVPGLLSLYLLARHGLWVAGLIATAFVTIVCNLLAQPVEGVGIAIPTVIPALAAAVAAIVVARQSAAAVAYISGSLGCLIGADLLNLDKLQGLDAPVASIGGAGTFDGVFLMGVIAVLLASLPRWR
ncbi:MAG: DUF1614 domain-containing protein [Rhodomicrobiaceae bacterium]